MTAQVDEIEIRTAPAPTGVDERLKLTDGDEVVIRPRRYLADGLPIETAVSYIPADLGPCRGDAHR